MLLSENFLLALRALKANTMRSALTMLGIVIGVATVVALLAIGNGATASITSDIEGIGSNLITIRPGREMTTIRNSTQTQVGYLYYSDYETLNKRILSNVSGISPAFSSSYKIKYGSESFQVSVTGVMEDYFDIRSYQIESGRAITDSDNDSRARVAVLGAQTAEDLFGNLNPLGKDISINGVKFQVVGLLQAKGSSGFDNPDDVVLIPLETGYSKLFGSAALKDGQQTVSVILLSADSAEAVDTVIGQAEYLLRREHEVAPDEEADFNVTSQADFLNTMGTITQTLTIFLGAIAAISLLVGGIGIMNIMLVSVTERTKEIGLRKAVGASKDQILLQFLIETMTLSILGGLIGILLGVGIAWLFTIMNLITSIVSIGNILMAFIFAVAVGLFFGIYPAYRAASLHPMEALRYE
ncbi:MAG: ABC transporter permease [Chloroflexota bacterium]